MLLYINEVIFYSQRPFVQIVLSGVFERFPRLKFVMTEAGCAWVPGLLEQLDRMHRRIRNTGATGEIRYSEDQVLQKSATEYFHQNVWMGVSNPGPDDVAARDQIGIDGSCGAATTRTTRAATRTPASTCGPASATSTRPRCARCSSENAAKLYDFDLDALAPLAAKIGPTVAEIATPIDDVPDEARSSAISGDMDARAITVTDALVLIDDPAPHVRRLTLNRPEKRNALNHPLRGQLIAALQARRPRRRRARHDRPRRRHVLLGRLRPRRRQRGPRVPALHGAGRGPVAPPRHRDVDGHLGPAEAGDRPGARLLPGRRQRAGHRVRPRLRGRRRQDGLPGGALRRARHAVPRLAARHAGRHGDDGHRRLDLRARRPCASAGPTGPSPRPTSTREVLAVAQRIALLPPDIVQLNKRTVHRAMDHMGLRPSIRAGTDICALGIHQESIEVFLDEMREKGLTAALQQRDEPFGDYRTVGAPRPSAEPAASDAFEDVAVEERLDAEGVDVGLQLGVRRRRPAGSRRGGGEDRGQQRASLEVLRKSCSVAEHPADRPADGVGIGRPARTS